MSRSFLSASASVACAIASGFFGLMVSASAQEVGIPTVGTAGVTLTIDELNQLQRQRDASDVPALHWVSPLLRPDRSDLLQEGTEGSPKFAPLANTLSSAASQLKSQTVSTSFTRSEEHTSELQSR